MRVLNASRHHGKGDAGGDVQGGRLPPCSTPLGITARGTTYSGNVLIKRLSCSTPLGITARGTALVHSHASGRGCAQRLSASRKGGQEQRPARDCGAGVLNASRHHGKGDSAARATSKRREMCSTPLGITARGTLHDRVQALVCRQVLNASRHHGKGDHDAHCGQPRLLVLNASRHHGKGDKMPPTPPKQHSTCSTPLGITARGTVNPNTPSWYNLMCSTPLGITARGTLLPGSTFLGRHVVLNASRHHGKGDR